MTRPAKFVVIEEHKEVWLPTSWTARKALELGVFNEHFPGYQVRLCHDYELDRLSVEPALRDRL